MPGRCGYCCPAAAACPAAACEPAATEAGAVRRPAPAAAGPGMPGAAAGSRRPAGRGSAATRRPARTPGVAVCPALRRRGGARRRHRGAVGSRPRARDHARRCRVGSGGVGVVGRCSSMRSRSVGGTTRPGGSACGGGGAAAMPGARQPAATAVPASRSAATARRRLDRRPAAASTTVIGGGSRLRRLQSGGGSATTAARSRLGFGFDRPGDGRLDRLDEPRRRQRRRRRLGRLGRLLRGRALLAFDERRLGEHVAARQRDVALAREALDELARDDFFDRARGALHLDAVVALEQRRHFLARRAEQFRDLVNPDSGQAVPQFMLQAADMHVRPA